MALTPRVLASPSGARAGGVRAGRRGPGFGSCGTAGAGWGHRRDHRVRAARPRRSRVPDRAEVGGGLRQRLARRADHGRRERGGRRAGLVQRSVDHAGRPVPGARRRAHRRLRPQRRHGDRGRQGDVHRRGRAPAPPRSTRSTGLAGPRTSSSGSSRDRPSTCTARRPGCWKRSTGVVRSRASRRRTATAPRSSAPTW